MENLKQENYANVHSLHFLNLNENLVKLCMFKIPVFIIICSLARIKSMEHWSLFLIN